MVLLLVLVLADRMYCSRAIREPLRGRGIRTVIPERADQQANRRQRGQAGGRPPAFDREAYKPRNTAERCINRFRQCRGIATHYEKTSTTYLAGAPGVGRRHGVVDVQVPGIGERPVDIYRYAGDQPG